ncbi:hypothetical protein JVU11DRAFT_3015 [Chiua virens]|nr:hypothetical protein JVU11DRAFT_7388 [Chiua virens]KAG9316933.1 hypothetical protein JVU11DRAFT_3015 [Chiua virens]
MEEYDSNVVTLRYVVDGNFTAQHMRMKKPDDDVFLANGLGYMVEEKAYQRHVATAAENSEVGCIDNWKEL